MAKFSQAFLQGLLQPTYQQGLFEAARGVGQAPVIMRMQQEREARQKGILGGTLALQRMAEAGEITPEILKEYSGSMQALGVDPEDILRTASEAGATSRGAVDQEAVSEVTRIQSELRELMSDPNADPSTVSIRRAALEKELLAAARNLPFSQQQQLEGFSAGLEATLESQQRAKDAAEREKTRFSEWFDNWQADSDIRDINRELAVERYEQYLADDVIRQANREKATLEGLNRSATAAYVRGGEEVKESWLAQNPGKEDVWKNVSDQQILNNSRVTEAKDNLLLSNFTYTDEKLEELGLSDSDIEMIKALPDNKNKNTTVVKMLQAKSTAGELPSAQMATIFSKAAEQRIMEVKGLRPNKEKELAQIKSLAAQLGLKAAQQAQKTGRVEDGFRLLSSYQEDSNILEMGDSGGVTPAGPTDKDTLLSEDAADVFISEQENR
jgi:hypothetical protein